MSYLWPIALVVISNIVYQICAKSVPKGMDPMASMTVTYLVGAVCSAAMYFFMNKNGSLLQEYSKMNLAPALITYHNLIMYIQIWIWKQGKGRFMN